MKACVWRQKIGANTATCFYCAHTDYMASLASAPRVCTSGVGNIDRGSAPHNYVFVEGTRTYDCLGCGLSRPENDGMTFTAPCPSFNKTNATTPKEMDVIDGWYYDGLDPTTPVIRHRWFCNECVVAGRGSKVVHTSSPNPPATPPCHQPTAANQPASVASTKCDLRWQKDDASSKKSYFECVDCGGGYWLASSDPTPKCPGYAKKQTLGSYPSQPPTPTPGAIQFHPPPTMTGLTIRGLSHSAAYADEVSVDQKLRSVFAPDPEPKRAKKTYPICVGCSRELSPTLDAYYGTDPAAKNQCVDCRTRKTNRN